MQPRLSAPSAADVARLAASIVDPAQQGPLGDVTRDDAERQLAEWKASLPASGFGSRRADNCGPAANC